jgi:molecular chaperone GrpE
VTEQANPPDADPTRNLGTPEGAQVAGEGGAEAAQEQLAQEQEAVASQQPSDPAADAASAETAAGATEDADASQTPGAEEFEALAAERLGDLQRLQAEYVNYKRRVDRDRAVVQERAVQSVLEAVLPVLDDIHAAREHGDLAGGPFAAIADKLESTLGKFGLERYGAPGEEFDPNLHEALMHTGWPSDGSLPAGNASTTIVQVLQPGYRAGQQVLRAARVAVADPE